MVEMTVLGISLCGENYSPVLLLHPRGTELLLRLSIGPTEAFAISSVLNGPEQDGPGMPAGSYGRTAGADLAPAAPLPRGDSPGAIFPRPSTHDLALSLIRALKGRLLAVELLHMADGVFVAAAVLVAGASLLRVDCRPSDGVALALRCGAAIQAADEALAHAENLEEALRALPDHVRLLARTRMAAPVPVRAATGEGGPVAPQRGSPLAPLFSAVATLRQTGKSAAGDDPPGGIRISLVRQTRAGDLEFLDEFRLPAPKTPEVRAQQLCRGGGAEEDHWAALLKALSPETKILM
ncbi:MAG: bifunctional nuclease family protein [Desulfovibrio sp.]|jgi:bifunctional DNase/RNase|nr:bifunctional nuclease family protein [Desulfovibrio sp.]